MRRLLDWLLPRKKVLRTLLHGETDGRSLGKAAGVSTCLLIPTLYVLEEQGLVLSRQRVMPMLVGQRSYRLTPRGLHAAQET